MTFPPSVVTTGLPGTRPEASGAATLAPGDPGAAGDRATPPTRTGRLLRPGEAGRGTGLARDDEGHGQTACDEPPRALEPRPQPMDPDGHALTEPSRPVDRSRPAGRRR